MGDKMAAGAYGRARNYGCDQKLLYIGGEPWISCIVL